MNRSLILIALAACMASTSILAESDSTPISLDGLELVKKDGRGELYVNPDVDWAVYDQIQLDNATVAFRRNWQRDQNRYGNPFKVKASDMEKIKSELSELFNEVFIEKLTDDGNFQMASESGDNVLRISPQIVDLDVYAPDTRTAGMQRSYTREAGKMTLKLELYDSVTGDLLATASERKEAPDRGYMQWTTSVSNRQDARLMFQRWATQLLEWLEEASALHRNE